MSEAPTISGSAGTGVIGPGRLVLVVGPSGAGKDTLIGLARTACADGDTVFPRRVVTREASPSEDNEHVGVEEFSRMRSRGEFALHWEAHGHCYGLRRSIDDDIRAGRSAVANVSRTIVEATRRHYADVVVVCITAPTDVLSQRLSARGRSSDGRVADRLNRAVDSAQAAPDLTIMNVGVADAHALTLVEVIRGGSRGRPPERNGNADHCDDRTA